MKYTTEQLEAISCHFNVFVEQDDDGNVAGNTSSPTAETGWRPIFKKQCQEALAAFNAETETSVKSGCDEWFAKVEKLLGKAPQSQEEWAELWFDGYTPEDAVAHNAEDGNSP